MRTDKVKATGRADARRALVPLRASAQSSILVQQLGWGRGGPEGSLCQPPVRKDMNLQVSPSRLSHEVRHQVAGTLIAASRETLRRGPS